MVNPFAVDLSSGVEKSPGLKDYKRYDVMTVRVDHYMDSFLEYERLISDHFPVLLSFSW